MVAPVLPPASPSHIRSRVPLCTPVWAHAQGFLSGPGCSMKDRSRVAILIAENDEGFAKIRPSRP